MDGIDRCELLLLRQLQQLNSPAVLPAFIAVLQVFLDAFGSIGADPAGIESQQAWVVLKESLNGWGVGLRDVTCFFGIHQLKSAFGPQGHRHRGADQIVQATHITGIA